MRITGVIYTARDAAHGRLLPLIDAGQPLPIDVRGQIIYYTGPVARAARRRGRLDRPHHRRAHGQVHARSSWRWGSRARIGKGARSQPVKDALRQHKGVYFGAIGGAGAVLSGFVKKLEIVAYEDLGTEAIRRLEVDGFPAIVVNDCHGGDLYQDGMKAYARENA